jgi:hypothetical protein
VTNLVWQTFEDTDGQTAYRAVCNGYLVFLTNHGGLWFVNVLMPEDEREKTYMAGPGFKKGVRLEEAQHIALELTGQARAKLERKLRASERTQAKKSS